MIVPLLEVFMVPLPLLVESMLEWAILMSDWLEDCVLQFDNRSRWCPILAGGCRTAGGNKLERAALPLGQETAVVFSGTGGMAMSIVLRFRRRGTRFSHDCAHWPDEEVALGVPISHSAWPPGFPTKPPAVVLAGVVVFEGAVLGGNFMLKLPKG